MKYKRLLLLLVLVFVLSSFSAYACKDSQDVEKCVADEIKNDPKKLGDSKYVNDPKLQKAVDEYVKNNKQLITPAFAKARMGLTLEPGVPVAEYNPPKFVTAKTNFDFTKYKDGKVLSDGTLQHGGLNYKGIIVNEHRDGFDYVEFSGTIEPVDGKLQSLAGKSFLIKSGTLVVPGEGKLVGSKDYGNVPVIFNDKGRMVAQSHPEGRALLLPEDGSNRPPMYFSGGIQVEKGAPLSLGKETLAGIIDKKNGFEFALKTEEGIFLDLDNKKCEQCVRYDGKTGAVVANGVNGVRFVPRKLASMKVENIPKGGEFIVSVLGTDKPTDRLKKLVVGDLAGGTLKYRFINKDGKRQVVTFTDKGAKMEGGVSLPDGFSLKKEVDGKEIDYEVKDGKIEVHAASLDPFKELIGSVSNNNNKLTGSQVATLKELGITDINKIDAATAKKLQLGGWNKNTWAVVCTKIDCRGLPYEASHALAQAENWGGKVATSYHVNVLKDKDDIIGLLRRGDKGKSRGIFQTQKDEVRRFMPQIKKLVPGITLAQAWRAIENPNDKNFVLVNFGVLAGTARIASGLDPVYSSERRQVTVRKQWWAKATPRQKAFYVAAVHRLKASHPKIQEGNTHRCRRNCKGMSSYRYSSSIANQRLQNLGKGYGKETINIQTYSRYQNKWLNSFKTAQAAQNK